MWFKTWEPLRMVSPFSFLACVSSSPSDRFLTKGDRRGGGFAAGNPARAELLPRRRAEQFQSPIRVACDGGVFISFAISCAFSLPLTSPPPPHTQVVPAAHECSSMQSLGNAMVQTLLSNTSYVQVTVQPAQLASQDFRVCLRCNLRRGQLLSFRATVRSCSSP